MCIPVGRVTSYLNMVEVTSTHALVETQNKRNSSFFIHGACGRGILSIYVGNFLSICLSLIWPYPTYFSVCPPLYPPHSLPVISIRYPDLICFSSILLLFCCIHILPPTLPPLPLTLACCAFPQVTSSPTATPACLLPGSGATLEFLL